MALEIIPGKHVYKTVLKHNQYKRWPTREKPDRLSPIATPHTHARFKISVEDKIFCIGSCFAEEISKALHRQKFNVLSIFQSLPESSRRTTKDAAMFHKYSVAAIYNEINWALNPDNPYRHEDVFIKTAKQQWQDYQLMGDGYSDCEDVAKSFRTAFNHAFKKIAEADVVIITLGLSEVWFDKQTQLYLNRTIPLEIINHYPDRFELHVFDYAKTLEYLEKIYTLLKTYLKPDFRLLITVSPIPLSVSFRQQDVLVANTYSKAVLRAAVEEFVSNKANVNYFPSYEFVTLSNPDVVLRKDDLLHVDATFVDYIVANVMAEFTDAMDNTDESILLLKAKSLYYGNFIQYARKLIKPMLAKNSMNKELWAMWGLLQLPLSHGLRASFFSVLNYFKTYRNFGLIHHFKIFNRWFNLEVSRPYVGYLDFFEGGVLQGWACCLTSDEPIEISILVNDHKIKTLVANLPRADVADVYDKAILNCGFKQAFDASDWGERYTLRVVFSKTGQDLPGGPIYAYPQ